MQIFFKPSKIFDHSCGISENPFGHAVSIVHSTFQATSNLWGSYVKNLFPKKLFIVYAFLWEVPSV